MYVRVCWLALAALCSLLVNRSEAQTADPALQTAIMSGNYRIIQDGDMPQNHIFPVSNKGLDGNDIYVRDIRGIGNSGRWVQVFPQLRINSKQFNYFHGGDNKNEMNRVFFVVALADSGYSFSDDESRVPASLHMSDNRAYRSPFSLTCFELSFPAILNGAPTSVEFDPSREGATQCGTEASDGKGRWMTLVYEDKRVPLLIIGGAESIAKTVVTANADAAPVREGENVTGGQVRGADEEAEETSNYALFNLGDLPKRDIATITLLFPGGGEGALQELDLSGAFGGLPGFWEVGITARQYHVRLPQGVTGGRLRVQADDPFVACEPAELIISADAFGVKPTEVACRDVEVPLTVAIESGFELTLNDRLSVGHCPGDDEIVTQRSNPSVYYCMRVRSTDARVQFDTSIANEIDRIRIGVEGGEFYNLADHVLSHPDGKFLDVTPSVRLKSTAVQIMLIGGALPDGFYPEDISLQSTAENIVQDVRLVEFGSTRDSGQPFLRIELQFEEADSLEAARNTTKIDLLAQSRLEALRFVGRTTTNKEVPSEIVSMSVDLARIESEEVRVSLLIARNEVHLPEKLTLSGLLPGRREAGRMYACRLGFRLGSEGMDTIYWTEPEPGGVVSLPSSLNRAFDPGEMIELVSGPADSGVQRADHRPNCLPEETVYASISAGEIGSEISVPYARPVLVYFLRTGISDEHYRGRVAVEDLYANWLDAVKGALNGQRIFAVRFPDRNGGFRTIVEPTPNNPSKSPMNVTSLVEGSSPETSRDIDLDDVFKDAKAISGQASGDKTHWPDIVMLGSSARDFDLGNPETCSKFVGRAKAYPWGATIVMLRDLRQAPRPMIDGRPYRTSMCARKDHKTGKHFEVHLVETKASEPLKDVPLLYQTILTEPLSNLVGN
jgi:hypothetical protein